jgi:probable addiction module antidote protein
MKHQPDYHQDLLKDLKDPNYAMDFLNLALEEDDKRVFLLALKDIAEAHGGMTKLSRLTKITREHIYRMLSKNGNPEFETLKILLDAFGFKIAIQRKKSRKAA